MVYYLQKETHQSLLLELSQRIIQGEKGIGRFAIHKLGTKIELYTRTDGLLILV